MDKQEYYVFKKERAMEKLFLEGRIKFIRARS